MVFLKKALASEAHVYFEKEYNWTTTFRCQLKQRKKLDKVFIKTIGLPLSCENVSISVSVSSLSLWSMYSITINKMKIVNVKCNGSGHFLLHYSTCVSYILIGYVVNWNEKQVLQSTHREHLPHSSSSRSNPPSVFDFSLKYFYFSHLL